MHYKSLRTFYEFESFYAANVLCNQTLMYQEEDGGQIATNIGKFNFREWSLATL